MRWVALILLAANLALASWIALGTPGGPDDRGGPAPELGELELLREAARESPSGDASRDASGGACFTIGPFSSAEDAETARERLASLELAPSQRTTRDQEVYGYQVQLPPRDTREAALETTRELASQGIEDYFVITDDPDRRNAISVGLFEQKRHAVQHTQYLEQLGFDPEMRLRTRTRTRYWQDYRDPEGEVDKQFLESLETDGALQRLERPCAS